jgi:hypothetical protein
MTGSRSPGQGATETWTADQNTVQRVLDETGGFGADYTFEATGPVAVTRRAVESARMGWGCAPSPAWPAAARTYVGRLRPIRAGFCSYFMKKSARPRDPPADGRNPSPDTAVGPAPGGETGPTCGAVMSDRPFTRSITFRGTVGSLPDHHHGARG